jgi:hypothetical protein
VGSNPAERAIKQTFTVLRKTDSTTLAKLCRVPIEALIERALKRLRCSQCNARECTHTANLPKKPRRLTSR